MKKVLVSGINGQMGQILCRKIALESSMEVVAGVDINTVENSHKVVSSIDEFDSNFMNNQVDVIIDFSSPAVTSTLISCAEYYYVPIVIGTTGLSAADFTMMKKASETIPIFYSSNMSYDICVFQRILEIAVPLLKTADIEITEEHHRRKADSPSGTAIILANTINNILNNEKDIVYGRKGLRKSTEIGISSVRGGNICGTHTVHFFGESDTLEIKHIAHSRDSFAEGAIRAAIFITEGCREPGLYSMKDLF